MLRPAVRDLLKALTALGVAVLLTSVLGSLGGYPDNAEAMRAHNRVVDTIVAAHPDADARNFQRLYEQRAREDPVLRKPMRSEHPVIAVLKTSTTLLFLVLGVSFIVLRPSLLAVGYVVVTASGAALLFSVVRTDMDLLKEVAVAIAGGGLLYVVVSRVAPSSAPNRSSPSRHEM